MTRKSPPLKDKGLRDIILRTANRKIKVNTPNGLTEVSAFEAAIRSIEKTAHSGSPHAQRNYMEIVSSAAAAQEQFIEDETEFVQNWSKMLREQRSLATKRGDDPECVLPCPDDIKVDDNLGIRVVGPTNSKELQDTYRTIKLRDALVLQSVFEERIDKSSETGSPLLLALLINNRLPERFRIDHYEFMSQAFEWEKLAKRELLKQCYQAWQLLGADFPRGYVFPKSSSLMPKLEAIFENARFLLKAEREGQQVTTSQLATGFENVRCFNTDKEQ